MAAARDGEEEAAVAWASPTPPKPPLVWPATPAGIAAGDLVEG